MSLFEAQTARMRGIAERAGARALAPVKDSLPQPRERAGLILQSEAQCELGRPGGVSALSLLYTNQKGRDGAFLIGKSLSQIASKSVDFALAVILCGEKLDAESFYQFTLRFPRLADHPNWMVKTDKTNIWVRVGREAAENALELAASTLIERIHAAFESVQAVELYNLVPVSRVVEELPNRAVDFSSSRLVRLLTRNIPIMVLDKETELRQLKAAFGSSVDISLIELRGELESVIPRVRGKSLFTLTTESRAALYADGHSEIETLLSLFTSCCIYKYPSLSRDYVRILDLVAIGTIADLMPLADENRILVRLGLKELSTRPRENLIQLLSAQNLLSHPLCAQDIGWYLSPVINASGRLGCPQVALDLLLSEDKQEMYDLTMKLLSLNKERQKRGEDAWNESRSAAKASLESFGSKFLLLDTGKTPRGLTGSLASRALNEFTSSPAVIVLSQCEGDRISASIRSRESLNCRDFLSKFSSFFIDFGGHKRAGGFSMKIENKEGFKKALEEEVMKMDIGGEEEEGLSVDALISENDMNLNLMKVVELFEPYGEANKPLVFLFSGAKIVDIITLGDPSKGNIKLTLQIGRTLWPCLWWGGRNSEGFDYETGDTIKLIFRLNRNYYKGMDNVQLTLLQCEKENPVR